MTLFLRGSLLFLVGSLAALAQCASGKYLVTVGPNGVFRFNTCYVEPAPATPVVNPISCAGLADPAGPVMVLQLSDGRCLPVTVKSLKPDGQFGAELSVPQQDGRLYVARRAGNLDVVFGDRRCSYQVLDPAASFGLTVWASEAGLIEAYPDAGSKAAELLKGSPGCGVAEFEQSQAYDGREAKFARAFYFWVGRDKPAAEETVTALVKP